MVSKFHITKEEYERRDRAPWPEDDHRTITPQPDTHPSETHDTSSGKRDARTKVDYSAERETLEKFLNEVMANEGVEGEDDDDDAPSGPRRKPRPQ